jgi:hypothetical protein
MLLVLPFSCFISLFKFCGAFSAGGRCSANSLAAGQQDAVALVPLIATAHSVCPPSQALHHLHAPASVCDALPRAQKMAQASPRRNESRALPAHGSQEGDTNTGEGDTKERATRPFSAERPTHVMSGQQKIKTFFSVR